MIFLIFFSDFFCDFSVIFSVSFHVTFVGFSYCGFFVVSCDFLWVFVIFCGFLYFCFISNFVVFSRKYLLLLPDRIGPHNHVLLSGEVTGLSCLHYSSLNSTRYIASSEHYFNTIIL